MPKRRGALRRSSAPQQPSTAPRSRATKEQQLRRQRLTPSLVPLPQEGNNIRDRHPTALLHPLHRFSQGFTLVWSDADQSTIPVCALLTHLGTTLPFPGLRQVLVQIE